MPPGSPGIVRQIRAALSLRPLGYYRVTDLPPVMVPFATLVRYGQSCSFSLRGAGHTVWSYFARPTLFSLYPIERRSLEDFVVIEVKRCERRDSDGDAYYDFDVRLLDRNNDYRRTLRIHNTRRAPEARAIGRQVARLIDLPLSDGSEIEPTSETQHPVGETLRQRVARTSTKVVWPWWTQPTRLQAQVDTERVTVEVPATSWNLPQRLYLLAGSALTLIGVTTTGGVLGDPRVWSQSVPWYQVPWIALFAALPLGGGLACYVCGLYGALARDRLELSPDKLLLHRMHPFGSHEMTAPLEKIERVGATYVITPRGTELGTYSFGAPAARAVYVCVNGRELHLGHNLPHPDLGWLCRLIEYVTCHGIPAETSADGPKSGGSE